MNDIQRYNFQRGIPEDRRFEGTTYISESPLDDYIMRTRRTIDEYNKREMEKRLEKEMEKEMEKKLEEVLEKTLDKLLSKF